MSKSPYGATSPLVRTSSASSSSSNTRSKILLLGQRRAGKSSVKEVLFNALPPKQTFYLETTMRVDRHVYDTVVPLEIWDCPGNVTVDTLGAPLSQFSALIFVIDIRDTYKQPISKLVEFFVAAHRTFYLETTMRVDRHVYDTVVPLEIWDCPATSPSTRSARHFRNSARSSSSLTFGKLVGFFVAAHRVNPSLSIEIFVHKSEKLQEEDKIRPGRCYGGRNARKMGAPSTSGSTDSRINALILVPLAFKRSSACFQSIHTTMPAERTIPTRPRGVKKVPTSVRVHKSPPSPMPAYLLANAGPKEAQLFRAWDKQVKKSVDNMTRVCIEHYSFERALEGKKQLKPLAAPVARDLSDERTSLEITDKNGYPLAIVLKNIFSEDSADKLYDTLAAFHEPAGIKVSQSGGADGHNRGAVKNYVSGPGFLNGVAKLAKVCHTGHKKEEPVAAAAIVKSGASFAASCQLFQSLRPLSARVNSALKHVDLPFYAAAIRARAAIEERPADVRNLIHDDIVVIEGREIMFNCKSALHRNFSDHKYGWTVLKAVRRGRDYHGGDLDLPELNVRLPYGHRDLVLIRGRILQHEVDAWTGGQRIAIAHHIYDSVWSYLGLQPPLPLPRTRR
uniref:GTP-binding protein n=1 Tax=Mycena chlorophos TaxID=658473 RepID=A0ABQ0L0E4_MYCCL|nr:predicted protein [Mycena chlorophos]